MERAELKDELAKDPGNPIKKYRVVFAEGRGVSWAMDRTFNAERGIKVSDVEQWARANLESYRGTLPTAAATGRHR